MAVFQADVRSPASHIPAALVPSNQSSLLFAQASRGLGHLHGQLHAIGNICDQFIGFLISLNSDGTLPSRTFCRESNDLILFLGHEKEDGGNELSLACVMVLVALDPLH